MDHFSDVLERAERAFFAELADGYPAATSGDFPPDADLAWKEAAHAAARIWLRLNAPEIEGSCYRLTRTVERYPHFTCPAGATGDVLEATADMVRLRMHEHLPGAEEWENEIIWTQADDAENISAIWAFLEFVRPR